jgi:acetyltransferase-like isoleucine patch superfamily enzyme
MVDDALCSANERLRSLGTSHDVAWMGEHLQHRTDVPDWFWDNGNRLFMPGGLKAPAIAMHPGLAPPRDAHVVIGYQAEVASVLLWGANAKVIIAGGMNAPMLDLNCGDNATIFLGYGISAGSNACLNARNGGSIVVEGDALWSTHVTIYTDDMHSIRDVVSGRRLNAFGGHVRVGSHVWLGREVMLLPGAHVGAHSVIGARAVVTGAIPPHSVAVGSPAKVVRDGVTWTFADQP